MCFSLRVQPNGLLHALLLVNLRGRVPLSSEGVSFEVPPGRRVSEAVRRGLVKAHCNLGHPSVADLQRLLKLGGAKQEVIEAAGWMKCMTCAHGRQPLRTYCSLSPVEILWYSYR